MAAAAAAAAKPLLQVLCYVHARSRRPHANNIETHTAASHSFTPTYCTAAWRVSVSQMRNFDIIYYPAIRCDQNYAHQHMLAHANSARIDRSERALIVLPPSPRARSGLRSTQEQTIIILCLCARLIYINCRQIASLIFAYTLHERECIEQSR